MRGWVGPRAGLNDVEKRKFFILPRLELWPFGCPACSQSLYRLRYRDPVKCNSSLMVQYQEESMSLLGILFQALADFTVLKYHLLGRNLPHLHMNSNSFLSAAARKISTGSPRRWNLPRSSPWLCLFGSFYDVMSISDCTASTDTMADEIMNCSKFRRQWSWPTGKYYPGICLEWPQEPLSKTKDSRCNRRGANRSSHPLQI
jgi:hypothetical protein